MERRVSILRSVSTALAVLLLSFSLGCLQGEPNAGEHEVGEGETNPEAISEAIKRGEPMLIIDARNAKEFEAGHIPGAVNLPLAKLSREAAEAAGASDDTRIIVYHTSSTGGRNGRKILESHGFHDAVYLAGGLPTGLKTASNLRRAL